jgi:hypothetical protein
MNIPHPNHKLRIDVKQRPGMNYPQPPHRVSIREDAIHATTPYRQPGYDRFQVIQ